MGCGEKGGDPERGPNRIRAFVIKAVAHWRETMFAMKGLGDTKKAGPCR